MRDSSISIVAGSIIDTYVVPVSLSSDKDPVAMTGTDNRTTITLRTELTCTDSIICQQPVNVPTSEGKHS